MTGAFVDADEGSDWTVWVGRAGSLVREVPDQHITVRIRIAKLLQWCRCVKSKPARHAGAGINCRLVAEALWVGGFQLGLPRILGSVPSTFRVERGPSFARHLNCLRSVVAQLCLDALVVEGPFDAD